MAVHAARLLALLLSVPPSLPAGTADDLGTAPRAAHYSFEPSGAAVTNPMRGFRMQIDGLCGDPKDGGHVAVGRRGYQPVVRESQRVRGVAVVLQRH